MKRPIFFLLCLLLLFSLIACTQSEPRGEAPTDAASEHGESTATDDATDQTEVTVPPESTVALIRESCIYLFVGEKYELSFTASTSEGAGDPKKIVWSTSSDCVAVECGTVRALKEGFATVSGGGASTCTVRVIADDMPVISVNTNGASITSKETYVPCLIGIKTENEALCFENASAGIRLRGNSTRALPKKPYRIKFSSKRNLLGLNEGAECKSWVLLAERYDDSFIRNSTAMTFASMIMTEYSSDWRYVRLVLNGEHKGVYLLAEQSQINPNRIDIEEAGAESAALESGYLFEIDASSKPPDFYLEYGDYTIRNFLGDRYTMTANDSKMSALFYSVKNDGLSSAQMDFAEKYMENVFKILYYATYDGIAYEFDENYNLVDSAMSPREAISAVIDIDSMVRKYIHSEILCNGDEHKKSYFMYVDLSQSGSGRLTFGCPWDFDTAFVHWDSVNYRETDVHYSCTRNLWYVVMLNNEWFRERVIETWDMLYEQYNGYRNALDTLLAIQEIYQGDFNYDARKWGRTEDHQLQISLTYQWLIDRIEWLNENIARIPA